MRKSRLLRSFVALIAVSSLLFLLLFATVQMGQEVLHHRAERLIADLQRLHADGGSWTDMQRIMSDWGAFGHPEGICTPQRCEYIIDLDDWIGELEWPSGDRFLLSRVVFFIPLIHWHAASLFLDLKAESGKVTEWRAMYTTEVPKGAGPGCGPDPCGAFVPYSSGEYSLMASAASTSNPDSYYWQWPAARPHPEYAVTQPSGCMNCIGIRSSFSPVASRDEVERLTRFNLDCITRWVPCTVAQDIFPDAWHELEEERKPAMPTMLGSRPAAFRSVN